MGCDAEEQAGTVCHHSGWEVLENGGMQDFKLPQLLQPTTDVDLKYKVFLLLEELAATWSFMNE